MLTSILEEYFCLFVDFQPVFFFDTIVFSTVFIEDGEIEERSPGGRVAPAGVVGGDDALEVVF
jgi:hypothetical protein